MTYFYEEKEYKNFCYKLFAESRAWTDRDQGNLRGLTLAQIPQTASCGLSPSKKMGLNVCCRESLGFLAREGIFFPCFSARGEGPRGKTSALRSGQKDLLM